MFQIADGFIEKMKEKHVLDYQFSGNQLFCRIQKVKGHCVLHLQWINKNMFVLSTKKQDQFTKELISAGRQLWPKTVYPLRSSPSWSKYDPMCHKSESEEDKYVCMKTKHSIRNKCKFVSIKGQKNEILVCCFIKEQKITSGFLWRLVGQCGRS